MDHHHSRAISDASRHSEISALSHDDLGLRDYQYSQQAHHILSPEFPPTPGFDRGRSVDKSPQPSPAAFETDSLTSGFPKLPPRQDRDKSWKLPKWIAWFRQKYWAYEVAAWLASLLVTGFTFALLYKFDQQTFGTWKLSITLNAFVSVCVTIVFLFLIFPVQSCLGQLKWNHFRRHHKLQDFDLMHEASRSAWGSFILMIFRPKHLLGLLGAILTICVHAIGPLAQQILTVGTVPVHTSDATIPIGLSYWETNQTNPVLDSVMEYSVYQAFFTMDPSTWPVYPVAQIGTNASWTDYSTLVVQHDCTDVSDQVTGSPVLSNTDNAYFKAVTYDYRLPNGHYLQSQYAPPGSSSNSDNSMGTIMTFNSSAFNPSIAYSDRGNVLVDFSLIYAPPVRYDAPSVPKPIAWNCMLQFASWPLNGSFINNDFYEVMNGQPVVNNSDFAKTHSPWQLAIGAFEAANNNTLSQNNPGNYCITMDPTEPNQNTQIQTCTTDIPLLSWFLDDVFTGAIKTFASPKESTVKSNLSQSNGGLGNTNSADTVGPMALVVGGPPPSAVHGFNLDALVNSTANSITNQLRTATQTGQRTTVTGPAFQALVVYLVRWGWASLPAALLVLTLVLIIFTAIDTHRKNMPVWTTSSLAIMLHGLDEAARHRLVGISEVEELEYESKRTRVYLRPQDKILATIDAVQVEETPPGSYQMYRPSQHYEPVPQSSSYVR